MASTKDIQRRIKSVTSTKKITKAMEMVSAAKMRRAVDAVLRTRTYSNLSWNTVMNLSRNLNGQAVLHPLLAKRDEVKRVGIILITSNRGLCGGFNSNIINKAHKSVQKHQTSIKADFILIGRKGTAVSKYYGYNIAADFPKQDAVVGIAEVTPIAKMVIADYLSGRYDKIMVAYTDFVNAGKQIPRVKQLLPIDMSTQDEYLGIVGQDSRIGLDKEYLEIKEGKHLSDESYEYEYTFEPNAKEVLEDMLPRLIEVQVYQAILESNASEHSARMASMHQATEAASDMVKELTLFYNKARQASITAEIAEISAGANALAE